MDKSIQKYIAIAGISLAELYKQMIDDAKENDCPIPDEAIQVKELMEILEELSQK